MTYAIIKTGGRQYRVAEGDTIDVDLLDIEPGKTATFEVLMHIDDGKLSETGKVTAEVVEQPAMLHGALVGVVREGLSPLGRRSSRLFPTP